MRKHAIGLIALLSLAVAAWAGDPWKQKAYKDWDQNDVRHILSDSPWARRVSIPMSGGPASVPGGPPAQAPAAGAGSYSETGPGGVGGGTANSVDTAASARMNEMNYTVEWFSSATIRRAKARQMVLSSAMSAEEAEKALAAPMDDYEILVQGNFMSVFQKLDQAALEKVTYLRPKKTKVKLSPAKVDIVTQADGKTVAALVFHFAKKSPEGEQVISTDEKGVEFVCEPRDVTIRTSFDLPKMVTPDGPDI